MIKVKRLDSKAILPVKAKKGDSGYDLCSIERKPISVGSTVRIKTGLAFQAPEGYELQVRPRSGLSSKGIIVTLGTIDNNYRGDVNIVVTNMGYDKFIINEGDKIAQIVPVAIPHFEIIEVDELSDTVRGSDGFGSTGLNTKTEQVDYISELHDKGLYVDNSGIDSRVPKVVDDGM